MHSMHPTRKARATTAAAAALAAGLALSFAAPAADAATPATAPTALASLPGFPGFPGLPGVVEGRAPSLHPEGVAWDPTRGAFLVSSLRHGTVSLVGADGSVRPFAADPRIVSTFGVHVDAARRRVLVAYGDIGLGARSTPETVGRSSGLAAFDLDTGRLLQLVDLAGTPGRHAANDLAVDRSGNVYVTDVFSTELYRVDAAGRASVAAADPRFAAEGFGMNGVVWHAAGFLLAVNYETGALFRIDVAGRGQGDVAEVALEEPLAGGDGLALAPGGSLLVVTNGLGGGGVDAVRHLVPRRGWAAAWAGAPVAWPDRSPTTVALTPSGAYVLAGRLEALLEGRTDDTFVLRRL